MMFDARCRKSIDLSPAGRLYPLQVHRNDVAMRILKKTGLVCLAAAVLFAIPASARSGDDPILPQGPGIPAAGSMAARDLASTLRASRDGTAIRDQNPVAADAFKGSRLFVGPSMKQKTSKARYEVGVAGGVSPLDMALMSNRGSLIDSGLSEACQTAGSPDCAAQAEVNANRAIKVIEGVSQSDWSRVSRAASNLPGLEQELRSRGVSDSDIDSIVSFLEKIPEDQRTSALGLARRIGESQNAALRIEPFTILNFPAIEARIGIPLALDVVGSGSNSDLGNVNVDLKGGWSFPVNLVNFGVSLGVSTFLPTSTGSDRMASISDLFQVPKYATGYLTFSPYVIGGMDSKWVSLQVHGQVHLETKVREVPGVASAQVFQYGAGLVVAPRFPLSVLAEVAGLEGLNNAESFKSLYVVGGLQARIGAFQFGAAVQYPLMDRAQSDLGNLAGIDVGRLSRLAVMARTGAAF
jgi:hypothetical protein